jgi:hypothetical protein
VFIFLEGSEPGIFWFKKVFIWWISTIYFSFYYQRFCCYFCVQIAGCQNVEIQIVEIQNVEIQNVEIQNVEIQIVEIQIVDI